MNHAGEITPLVGFVRPHVALVTTIAPVHIEYLGSIEAIADAKAEIFSGRRRRRRRRSSIATRRSSSGLPRRRARAGSKCATFGASEGYARLRRCEPGDAGSRLARPLGERELAFELGAPGAHMARERGRRARRRRGARRRCEAAAARRWRISAPQKGRGERFALAGCPAAPSPSSTRATTPTPPRCAPRWRCSARPSPAPAGGASPSSATCWNSALEGAALHAGLAPELERDSVDCCSPPDRSTRALYDAAPPALPRRLGRARRRTSQTPLVAALRAATS